MPFRREEESETRARHSGAAEGTSHNNDKASTTKAITPRQTLYSMFAKRNPFRKKSLLSPKVGKIAIKSAYADIACLQNIATLRRWYRGALSILSLLSIIFGMLSVLFPSADEPMHVLNTLVCVAGIGCVLRLYSVKATRAGFSDPLYEGRSSIIHSPYLGQMCLELALWAFTPPYLGQWILGGGREEGSSDSSFISSVLDSLDYFAFLRLFNLVLYAKAIALGQHLFVRALSTLGHVPVSTSYFIRTAMVFEKTKTSLLCGSVAWLALGLAFHQAEGRQLFDSFYFVFVTAGTIGYGDIAPTTYVGKIISFASWFFGLLIVGWVVSLFQQSLNLTEAERNLYLMQRANVRSRQLREEAAKTLQLAWRFYSVNRLKRLVNGRPVLTNSAIVLAATQPAVNEDGTSNIHVEEVLGGAIVGSSNTFVPNTHDDPHANAHHHGKHDAAHAPHHTPPVERSVIVGRSFQQAMQMGAGNTAADSGLSALRPIVVEDGATASDGNPITVASLQSNSGLPPALRPVISTSANSRENIALSYAAWRLRTQCQRFKRLRIEFRDDVAVIVQSLAHHEQRVYAPSLFYGGGIPPSPFIVPNGLGGGAAPPPFINSYLGMGIDPSSAALFATNPLFFSNQMNSTPPPALCADGMGENDTSFGADGGDGLGHHAGEGGVHTGVSPSMTLRSPSERSTPNGLQGVFYPLPFAHPSSSHRRRASSQISTSGAAAPAGQINSGSSNMGVPNSQNNSNSNSNMASRKRTLSEISVTGDDNYGTPRTRTASAGPSPPPAGQLPPSAAALITASGTRSDSGGGGGVGHKSNSGNSVDHMEMPRSPRRGGGGGGGNNPHLYGPSPPGLTLGYAGLHGVSMEDVLQLATHTAAVSAAAITHQHHAAAMGQSPHHLAGAAALPTVVQQQAGSDPIATRKLHQEMKKFTTILTQVADQQSVLLMTIQELKADIKLVQQDQERMRRNPMRHLFLEQGSSGQQTSYSGQSSINNSMAMRNRGGVGMPTSFGSAGGGGGGGGGMSNPPSNPNSPSMGFSSSPAPPPPPTGSIGINPQDGRLYITPHNVSNYSGANYTTASNSSFSGVPHGSLLYRPGTLDNGSFYAPPPPSGALASTVMGQEEVPHVLRSNSNNPTANYGGSRESLLAPVAGGGSMERLPLVGSALPPAPISNAAQQHQAYTSQFTVVNTANNSSNGNGSHNSSFFTGGGLGMGGSTVRTGSINRQQPQPATLSPSTTGGGKAQNLLYPPAIVVQREQESSGVSTTLTPIVADGGEEDVQSPVGRRNTNIIQSNNTNNKSNNTDNNVLGNNASIGTNDPALSVRTSDGSFLGSNSGNRQGLLLSDDGEAYDGAPRNYSTPTRRDLALESDGSFNDQPPPVLSSSPPLPFVVTGGVGLEGVGPVLGSTLPDGPIDGLELVGSGNFLLSAGAGLLPPLPPMRIADDGNTVVVHGEQALLTAEHGMIENTTEREGEDPQLSDLTSITSHSM